MIVRPPSPDPRSWRDRGLHLPAAVIPTVRPQRKGRPRRDIGRAYIPPTLYWIVAFIIVAPLSISADSSPTLKWIRLLLTIAACISAIPSVGTQFFGNASRALTAFMLLHLGGAIWSLFPVEGVLWKSFFVISASAGLLLAISLRDAKSFARTLRILTLVAFVSGTVILAIYLRNPAQSQTLGRLSVAGINANNIGQATLPLFLISICLLVSDASRGWKRLAITAAILALLVILGTGSRGALLACVAGICVPTVRLLKGRFTALLTATVILVTLLLTVLAPSPKEEELDGDERIVGIGRMDEELTKDTRSAYWGFLWKEAKKSPLLGHGWFTQKNSARSLNAMNIYLQVFYEEGIVGTLVFGGFVWVLVSTMKQALEREKERELLKLGDASAMMASCLLVALLVHGLAESSTLLGTTTNAMFLGFATGLLDRHRVLYGPSRRTRTTAKI